MKIASVRLFAAAMFCLAIGVNDSVAQTAIEQFDYPTGTDIATLDGGSGWAGPWDAQAGTGSLKASAGTLSYPNLPDVPAGNKMFYDFAEVNSTNTRRFLAEGYSSGTFYVSLIMQNLNGGGRFAGLALFSNNTEKMLIGQGSQLDDSPEFPVQFLVNHVLDNGTGTVQPTNTLFGGPSTVESLLVARIDLDYFGGTSERVTFWVNPDLSLPEDQNMPVGGGGFETDNDFATINRVRIGGGATNANGTYARHVIDEIRLSDISPFNTGVPGLPGDFNNDGKVDAADYTVWRDNLGDPYTEDDYIIWKNNFGNESPGAASLGSATAVPEPSALLLVGMALLGLKIARRRR